MFLFGDGHFVLFGETNRDDPARRASDGCAGGRPVRTKDPERANRSVRRSVDSRTKKEQSTKTRGSASDVPMPPELEKRLRDFLRKHYRENPSGYVFANRNSNSYSVSNVTECGF